jgi:L-aminopeptidase/D-esterase-like protein
VGDIIDVPGVTVGHWTHGTERTGCTVIVFPHENEAAVEVRGAAPATRETDLLAPGMSVRRVDAIVLSGGSAFGLATADGVMGGLEADGRGHPTPAGPVPIVPAAAIFDLVGRDAAVRPDGPAGRAAYGAAAASPTSDRFVGAGAGATVGQWSDPASGTRGGIGSASVAVGDAVVGAIAVVNAVGSVAETPRFDPPAWAGFGANTTLVVVATDGATAPVDRLVVRAQDAVAATIHPSHTAFDGDVAFAVRVAGGPTADPAHLTEGAFWAVRAALRAAAGVGP